MKTILSILALSFLFIQAKSQEIKSLDLDPFSGVKISGPFVVTLIQGEKNHIEINSEDIPINEFDISVGGGTLKVSLENRNYFNNFEQYDLDNWGEITITYQSIDYIRAGMGAQINFENKIIGESLIIEAFTGAEIKLMTETINTYININTGAVVEIDGTSNYTEVKLTTGAQLNARHLQSDEVVVKAGTGSVGRFDVKESIECTAVTGGEIYYFGNPRNVYSNTILGGIVSKGNF